MADDQLEYRAGIDHGPHVVDHHRRPERQTPGERHTKCSIPRSGCPRTERLARSVRGRLRLNAAFPHVADYGVPPRAGTDGRATGWRSGRLCAQDVGVARAAEFSKDSVAPSLAAWIAPPRPLIWTADNLSLCQCNHTPDVACCGSREPTNLCSEDVHITGSTADVGQ